MVKFNIFNIGNKDLVSSGLNLEKNNTYSGVENNYNKSIFGNDNEASLLTIDKQKLEKLKSICRNLIESGELNQKALERIDTLDEYDLSYLLKLDEDSMKRACKLLFVEKRKKQLNVSDITNLSLLPDEKFEKIKKFLFIENRMIQFNGNEILTLVNFSEDELKKAEPLLTIPGRGRFQFTDLEIAKLVTLQEEELEKIKPLLYVEDRYVQFDADNIVELVKLPPQLFDRALKALADDVNVEINGKNSELRIRKENVEHTIDIAKKIDHYITYGNYKDTNIPQNEDVLYYDEQGNIIKTLRIDVGNLPEIPDISITRADGTTIPIQWSTVNQTTGEINAERHYISPNGVTTDYEYTESENLKIIDYTIVDKDSNVLLDRHLTFEKISDNEYISSINGYIYKSIFKDNILTVIDIKSNEINEVDLSEICELEDNEIIDVIKNTPANLLMHLGKIPINIERDPFYFDSGKLENSDGLSIKLGTLTYINRWFSDFLAIFIHEFGHYLDFNIDDNSCSNISGVLDSDNTINRTFRKEYERFKQCTSEHQQECISYFTEYNLADDERVAETTMILNAGLPAYLANMRVSYFMEYFPETIAEISKAIDVQQEKLQNY
ncbi:MAG: hypothetical protein MJ237_02665 [bacterium]|nr:hypothetical protein [bacterium]